LQAAYRPVTRRNCIEIRRPNAYVWNAKPVSIWDVDTVRDYATVNGQTAHGGSLDGPGPVIAGGIVYVSSGYAQFGGMPGNVLLAFSVDGK
jgi:hypothetical protein